MACLVRLFIWGLVGLSWVGCGPSISDDDDDSSAPVDASFVHVRDDILLPSCSFSVCHGNGAGGLTLSAEKSYADLVGVPSAELPDVVLVKPGDPDHSYLIWKLESAAGIQGDPMPLNGEPLKAEDIEAIRAWISAGALND